MKNFRRLFSQIIAASLMLNLFPTYALTSAESENLKDKDKPTLMATHIGDTGIGNNTIVSGVTIPPFTLDSNVAYCMNALKSHPVNEVYTPNGSYDNDSYLRALAYYGYGLNKTGLREKHGITEEEARAYTQFAIWEYIETGYFAPKSYPYLDELVSLAKNTGIPSPQFNLGTSNPNVNESGGLQVSDVITTSSNYKGTFTFPSDDNVFSVDTNGQRKNTFNIGESFKVVAKAGVKGNISKNITVNVQDVTLLRYVPNNSTVQDLGVPSAKTTSLAKTISVNFPGIVTLGDVSVIKKDDSGNPLAGVEFGIYSDSATNNLVERKTTSADGRLTFTGLNVGTTYYVKEISGLTGYVMDTSVKNVVVAATPQELSFVNTKIMGQIKVIKSETGKPDVRLKGAEFQILNSADAVVDSIVTGDDGVATSIKLPYGSYKVRESKAPVGYTLSDLVIDINITEHNRVYETPYDNNFIKGSIEIIKKDIENNKPLEGVKFGIYKTADDSLIEEIVTNADGRTVTSELRFGEYYIKEHEAKEGYILDETKYPIVISENLKVYPQEIFNERIKGDMTIFKYDSGSGSPLKGVQFVVECLEGIDKGKTWSIDTDENGYGEVKSLNYGKYQIVELKTIEGYVLDTTPIPFEIKNNGEVIKLEMSNDKIYGELQFEKIDAATGEIIAGAQIKVERISDLNKDNSFEFESTIGGDIFLLPYGKYKIYEISAPDGYVLSDAIGEFEITVDGEIIEVKIENRKKQGTLIINKLSEGTKKPLSGAVFGIYDENKDLIIEVTTNKNGIAKVENLDCGKYYYGETKAPVGYLVDLTLYEFELTDDGEIIEKTAYNRLLNPFPDGGDEKGPLPDTSGMNTYIMIGNLLSLTLAGIFLIRRKPYRR